MILVRAFMVAVLGAPHGTLALPTPRNLAHEASEPVVSTGCAQELAMAFATLPALCGVEAGDDAFETGGWELRAAACLMGGHKCSPGCAVAVQVLRPLVGLLRELGVAVVTADDSERQTAPSVMTHRHSNSENVSIAIHRATSVAAAALPSNRRMQSDNGPVGYMPTVRLSAS
eukprot:COSAG02_NODE_56_length_43700_cov_33.650765_6_plen_173_part_00